MSIQLIVTLALGLVTAILAPAVGWLIKHSLDNRERISDLETKIAETYATNAYVREVEGRLSAALTNINSKLDRLIERGDR